MSGQRRTSATKGPPPPPPWLNSIAQFTLVNGSRTLHEQKSFTLGNVKRCSILLRRSRVILLFFLSTLDIGPRRPLRLELNEANDVSLDNLPASDYRGASLIRSSTPLGPCSRSRALNALSDAFLLHHPPFPCSLALHLPFAYSPRSLKK